jgi:hypothetical protein
VNRESGINNLPGNAIMFGSRFDHLGVS